MIDEKREMEKTQLNCIHGAPFMPFMGLDLNIMFDPLPDYSRVKGVSTDVLFSRLMEKRA